MWKQLLNYGSILYAATLEERYFNLQQIDKSPGKDPSGTIFRVRLVH